MAQSDPEQPTPQSNPTPLLGVTDLWIALTTREQVEEYLKRVIKVIHEQGFFVSGQITVDDKRTCPNCGYQMTWVPNLGRHDCSKCMANVVEAFAAQPNTTDANLYSGADTKLCDNCGNIAVRTGTCYTCQTCGTNSGCG